MLLRGTIKKNIWNNTRQYGQNSVLFALLDSHKLYCTEHKGGQVFARLYMK